MDYGDRQIYPMLTFSEAFRDVSSASPRVPQTDYLRDGKFPVIDQGARPVAGFVDDSGLLSAAALPTILFGDHTRRFKFVDRPFAVGADGVKILASSSALDVRFAYHYLNSVEIPNAGYARHYKFLKDLDVPAPPVLEQRRIAAILDQVEELRSLCLRSRGLLEESKMSWFVEMFGSPRTTDPTAVPLNNLIDPQRPLTYGILMPGPDIPDGVPYVRVLDMIKGVISLRSVRRTTPEISESFRRSVLSEGDLLMSIRGHVGRTAIVPRELEHANITQDTARIALRGISAEFVMAWLSTPEVSEWLSKHTKGAAVRGINLGDVKRIPIPMPTSSKQRKFDEIVSEIRALDRLYESRSILLDELFASLQHRAFRGEL